MQANVRAKKKKTFKQRLPGMLRFAIILCGVVFISAAISSSVISSLRHREISRYDDNRDAELESIINHLEYTGLDDAVKTQMADFSAKYTDFSNFIVTDSAANVLYALNQGYLDGSGKFYAGVGENGGGLVCDANGIVLSRHSLYSNDYTGLLRLGKLLPAISQAQTDEEGEAIAGSYAYGPADLSGIYFEGYMYNTFSYGYNEYAGNMNYAGVPSKNMHVFLMHDRSNKWSFVQQAYSNGYVYEMVDNLLARLGVCAFLLYWMLMPVWVFVDAAKRDNHPALWGVLTLVTNIIGLIVYLVVRPEKPTCKTCGESMSQAFVVCPLCGTRNKAQCCSCGKVIEEHWVFCPYCGQEVTKTDCGLLEAMHP